jgi:hypothetical protein
MRDMVFRNLTSQDRRKRLVQATEVADAQGIHSVIRRHFIYMVREVTHHSEVKPAPYLFAVRDRNSKELKERFFCKIKGATKVAVHEKIYMVYFIHTINICLTVDECKPAQNAG